MTFLQGQIATDDGAAIPEGALIERVCNGRVRQQVYAAPRGYFSMQMGSKADSFLDASGDRTSQYEGASKVPETGISRRELANCELRASASGFHPSVVSLVDLSTLGSRGSLGLGTIDVGAIVMERAAKMRGMTLSAIPYKAPADARKAYEKGVEAESDGKLTKARQYFQRAVDIYPSYAIAWYQLGTIFQKENQRDAARTAYIKAMTVDAKLLPPYLSLASLAYEAENWTEVLKLTNPILETDPFRDVAGYVMDLDPFNYAEAYFYNSVANYKLNKFDDAKKSALKTEQRLIHFPQLHLLLAEIFLRKNDHAAAISEMRTYLELAPHAKEADQVREQLAKLEKLDGPVPTSEKPDPR